MLAIKMDNCKFALIYSIEKGLIMSKKKINEEISRNLKSGPEQELVVGPLVQLLVDRGWDLGQIYFGKNEWKVPKSPSEASKRDAGHAYDFFPVDIAVFGSPSLSGDYKHLLFIIECKQPDITVGISQLETYLSLEPHVQLGIWANNASLSAESFFVYKTAKGLLPAKKMTVKALPSIGDDLRPTAQHLTFSDLIVPSEDVLYNVFSELLDEVVARDSKVTRREEQLDQLCNLILLKLNSDKEAKLDSKKEVSFRVQATESETAKHVKALFSGFISVYPDIFVSDSDKEIRLNTSSIYGVVEKIAKYNFIDVGPNAVSYAFQVLRSAALKQQEGQYFTPHQVIEAAIKLVGINLDDIIIDPACGTGGFLIECLMYLKSKFPRSETEISRWAQLRLFGIDKDAIGIKLTKAIMQILGDGSAHCVCGDSVLTHTWPSNFPHLMSNLFVNGRFTKIFTNPPFGAPLKVKYSDAKKAGLSIVNYVDPGLDIELGLTMFNRCCDLLKPKGILCIVLPETYFFSPSYKYVRDWVQERMKPICVANVPMDAFQGFCRAKTNLYVFEKLEDDKSNLDIKKDKVDFINPQTCGIYKNGSTRFVVDANGKRTSVVDNQLLEQASAYGKSHKARCVYKAKLKETYDKEVLVPQYYDSSLQAPFDALLSKIGCQRVTIGELCDKGLIRVLSGHGSPSNDLRNGDIPYVKVSDIRNLRINVNPTNLVPLELAKQFWKTSDGQSNLKAWDLISPSRASSNIGEFAVLLPGEEQIVVTKEVFIIRQTEIESFYTPFYLLWALSLKEVRRQWQRISLMQTNREDVGNRFREITIPKPKSQEWADSVSAPFKKYFEGISDAKKVFAKETNEDDYNYIASVSSYNHSID